MPFSLSDELFRLTKGVLSQIAGNFGIKRMSHLKKQELIEELEKQIPERIAVIFYSLDDDRYRLAKKIYNKGYTHDFNLEEHHLSIFSPGG